MCEPFHHPDEEKVVTADCSSSIINILVDELHLSFLSQHNEEDILITSTKKGYKTEHRTQLELENPNGFGLVELSYTGKSFYDYFPRNATIKVSEILLTKSDTEFDKLCLANTYHIFTKNETDCRYLFERAIEFHYTVILAMTLEVTHVNKLSQKLVLYLHDANEPLLHRTIRSQDSKIFETLLKFKLDVNKRSRRGLTPLIIAIELEMLDIVEHLVSNGANVNLPNNKGEMPLHYAIEKKNFRILKSLFKSNYKLNVNAKKKAGWTPLLMAVESNMYDAVNLLINNGADVNVRNDHLQSALHLAVKNNNLDILDTLLGNHAKFDEKNKNGQTPLHKAALTKNSYIVDLLLKKGANCKLLDSNGCTPFHIAAQNNDLPTIKIFLDGNVDANILNSRLQTPLFYVNKKPSKEDPALDKKMCSNIINTLLQKGAIINFQDENGLTPLHFGVMKNNGVLVQSLLEFNADITIKTYSGMNAAFWACHYQSNKCLRMLLKKNVNINDRYKENQTLLHMAVEKKNKPAIQIILKKKPNLEIQNNEGDTALHTAIKLKCLPVINLLLRYMPNVNFQDKLGNTAFHLATRLRHFPIMQLLLRSNANVNVQNKSGETALQSVLKSELDSALYSALPFNSSPIVTFLLKIQTNANLKDANGNNALHMAVRIPKIPIEIIKSILQSIDDIHSTDDCGRAAIHWVLNRFNTNADESCVECIKTLLDNKADINAVDNDGRTPIHYACWHKRVEAVKYLIKKKADYTVKDKDGKTVFHYACMIKENEYDEGYEIPRLVFEKLFDTLIEKHTSVNCVDNFGRTPLHYIAKHNVRSEIHALLLNIGADINIEDNEHNLVLDEFIDRPGLDRERFHFLYSQKVIEKKCLGWWVIQRALDKVYGTTDYNKSVEARIYDRECTGEVILMNHMCFEQSKISYFEFLNQTPHRAIDYIRNRNLVKAIESDKLSMTFPIYDCYLKCHLRETKKRRRLYCQIYPFFKFNIFLNLSKHTLYQICQYIDIWSLKKFLEAIRVENLE